MAFDESNRLNSVHVHDGEDATINGPKIDQILNNEATTKIENKKDNQPNDVPRD